MSKELKIPHQVLEQRQRMPLDLKIGMTLNRIRHWYRKYSGNVYIAFSGGKDSTVLLHLARTEFPDIPAVFVDTGLEYPEIRDFVKHTEGVTWLKPTQTFVQVLERSGWPVISKVVARAVWRIRNPNSSERTKHKMLYGDERGSYGKLPKKWRFLLDAPFGISDRCCEVMKIRPVSKYYKQTGRAGIVGTMAADSNSRRATYMQHGCYLTHYAVPRVTPMAFWKEEDVWKYLREKKVPYCSVYDTGVRHTGCVFCCFGLHMEDRPNRFDLLRKTHPFLYKYCMEKLGLREVLNFLGISERPMSLDVLSKDKSKKQS